MHVTLHARPDAKETEKEKEAVEEFLWLFVPITLLATTTAKMGVRLTSLPNSHHTGRSSLLFWINMMLE